MDEWINQPQDFEHQAWANHDKKSNGRKENKKHKGRKSQRNLSYHSRIEPVTIL